MTVMNQQTWQQRAKIWEGLENFRRVLTELIAYDVNKINQASLDKLFTGYDFKYLTGKKAQFLQKLEEEIAKQEYGSDVYADLIKQKDQLETMDEELVITKETDEFIYEYVLKSKETMINLMGFVKITNKMNSRYRGLLSWQQDTRDPILFLAEMIPDASGNPNNEKMYFHINLGTQGGMAIVEENNKGYRWTQCLQSEYSDLMGAEFGSVFMDKETKQIQLEDSNIAAATALSKAQTKTDNGSTILENNIALMRMYEQDLKNLELNY